MQRYRVDRVVKEWKRNGVYFEEHACVAAAVLPERLESVGLHGVLRNDFGSLPIMGRLEEAIAIAESNDIYLFVDFETDEAKQLWGGECKEVFIYPNEAEVALIPKEVLQTISSNSMSLRETVKQSFSYYQEDEILLRLDENLILLERHIKDCVGEFYPSMPLALKTKILRHLVNKVAEDTAFEGTLHGNLHGKVQHEAANTICEGIRFLHAFR